MIKFILVPFLAALWPLILPLGRNFEYEYATLNAYACLLLIPLAALASRSFLPIPKRLLAMGLGVLCNIIPSLIFVAVDFCRCSGGEVRTFWWLQTLPHLLLGFGLATWIERARVRGHTPVRLLLISGTFLSLSCLYLVVQIWLDPQKRATHVFAGFLHGAIYDNWIPLDPGIVWARAGHALLGLALLGGGMLRGHRLRLPVGGVLLAAWAFCAWNASHSPSQTHGLRALKKNMPDILTGPGFTLHYVNRPLDGDFQRRLSQIYESARFHTQDLMQVLAVPQPGVHIFVYPNREIKKLWFGGDGTDITDVVTPSIHITADAWPHPTLRHELVHAIASRFAYHGLGFHPNMAFTEGLAVALAPSDDDLSLHEGAADILQNNRIADVEQLFSPLFWSESGNRAYTIAGSLIMYLLQEGGLAKVKALYAGADWEEAFGQPAATTIRAWQDFLKTHYAKPGAALQAEALYRYPGILRDHCPHSKAALTKADGFLVKQRQPSGWNVSQDYWPWRVSLGQDPGAQVMLLRQRFRALIQGSSDANFEADLAALQVRPPKIQEHIEAYILSVDRRIQAQTAVDQDLAAYIQQVTELRIGDSLLRQLWVRWLLVRDVPQDRSQAWLKLLADIERRLPEALPKDATWIETYLYLRNKPAAMVDIMTLERIARTPLPKELPATFELEWWKILGDGYLQKGDLDTAIRSYKKAVDIAPEGSRANLQLIVAELEYRKKPQSETN